ncbi:Rap1 GTPase-GDP dissociation stimulator 1-A [Bagarius yarrelli]|uniref:Rap1 GTPase-GDP dissociation stimulator 1-A n=1 Tax=Bagarius yarrelli TaxID=175774 RepID=A0A556TYV3_BAGYA|nr:Rap1 GTPase-GDP dissociation stimulator 1-A [Bagarius yarrelli]
MQDEVSVVSAIVMSVTYNLSEALETLKLSSGDKAVDSVESCLECLLKALAHNNVDASRKIQEMGVLPMMPSLLATQNSCTPKVANIIAEVAKNEFMRSPCVEAGLIPPLVQLLNCKDQEVLLQTGRALGNICYDSHEGRSAVHEAGAAQIVAEHIKALAHNTDPATGKLLTVFCGMLMNYSNDNDTLQAQLISMGVIPTLVKLLGVHAHNTALTEMCLIAFGNLAELESSKEQFAATNVAEELVRLFRKQGEHEKKEMIFEVLAPLAENDESMQKLFEGGKGSVFQKVLSWVPSNNHQLQLAGALAIANFARNVVNKSKMLSAGVSDVVLKFLQSEMPPVQFKLLGTLRMLIDTQVDAAEQLGTNRKLVERLVEWCEAKDHAGVMGESNRLLSALIRHSKSKEVVRTVIQCGGVKHLVTMATSEHMIMQNEALVALGLIAALDLDSAEKDFVGSTLVQVLHKLLTEEKSAPEIKYNSMILICSVMGSEPLHKEVRSLAFIDVVSKLRSHENKTVAHQASLTEQRLTAQS